MFLICFLSCFFFLIIIINMNIQLLQLLIRTDLNAECVDRMMMFTNERRKSRLIYRLNLLKFS